MEGVERDTKRQKLQHDAALLEQIEINSELDARINVLKAQTKRT